jgi:hypothetical protein
MTREQLRKRIIRRLRKIIRESLENIAMIEWWNTNRLDQPPLDCEGDRVVVKLAREAMASFLRGDSREIQLAAFRRLSQYTVGPRHGGTE